MEKLYLKISVYTVKSLYLVDLIAKIRVDGLHGRQQLRDGLALVLVVAGDTLQSCLQHEEVFNFKRCF